MAIGNAHKEGPNDPFMAFVTDDVTHKVMCNIAGAHGWQANRVFKGGARIALRALSEVPTPTLLVVDLSGCEDPIEEITVLSEVCDVGTRVIALGEVNDLRLYRELIDFGVDDYLLKPIAPEAMEAAIARSLEEPDEASQPDAEKKDQFSVVIGSHGGVGASTVASNLAWLLAHEHDKNTALVDLDIQFSTAALALDLEPGRGFREALENPSRIDSLFLERALVKESAKLSVLAAEEALDSRVEFAADSIGMLIGKLRNAFQAVVMDLPRHMLVKYPDVLFEATTVIIVTDFTLVGMRDSLRMINFIKKAAPKSKIQVVGNHATALKGAEMALAEFEKGIGSKVDLELPIDAKSLAKSSASGKAVGAIAKGSKFDKALKSYCLQLVDDGDEGSSQGTSILSRLFHLHKAKA